MTLKQIAIAGSAALAVHATSARADSIEDFGPRRELAGHVFFPSLIITDPFISTHIALSGGAGYEWIDGPDFDAFGNRLDRKRSYRAQALAEALTFQATVADWMALRITAGGGLDGGSNGRSAVVVGAIQPISVGAGTTLSWRLTHIARFGITADFVYSHTKVIQPLALIQRTVLASVATASVSEKNNNYSVLPGLALAVAPSAALGLLASAQYNWLSVRDGSTQHFQYVTLGASAQLDLLPDTMVPVGFLASYRVTIPVESDVRFAHIAEGGLFYTGRKDLDLGLDVQGKWFDLRPERHLDFDTTEVIGIVEIRYHWN